MTLPSNEEKSTVYFEPCDVCGGTGTPVSKRPCICNGSGKMAIAMTEMRKLLYDAELKLESLLSTQAAIEKISKLSGNDSLGLMFQVKDICHHVDLSVLHEHDAEIIKPLVQALKQTRARFPIASNTDQNPIMEVIDEVLATQK